MGQDGFFELAALAYMRVQGLSQAIRKQLRLQTPGIAQMLRTTLIWTFRPALFKAGTGTDCEKIAQI